MSENKRKIFTLNTNQFEFNQAYLPCLIHWVEKSGTSYFSVSLIENLILQNSKVIFFTAFSMAKEQLIDNIWLDKLFKINIEADITKIPNNKSIIIQSGNLDLLEKVIQKNDNLQDYIIFIKNIEEYNNTVIKQIKNNPKIILSGNLDACSNIEILENIN